MISLRRTAPRNGLALVALKALTRAPALVACAVGLMLPNQTDAQDKEPFLLGPPTGDGPAVVLAGLVVNDVNEIDEGNQRFEFEGLLTLRWRDDRLAFDPEVAGVSEKIYQGDYQIRELATGWWPQLVIANESGGYEHQGSLLRHRSDGVMTYVEEMNAWVEMPLELRRFPFDREQFEIVFQVLGMGDDEVVLEADPETTGTASHGISIAQWQLSGVSASSRGYALRGGGSGSQEAAAFVVTLDVARLPGFMLRVVVLPMILLVVLSWSVFWMDRESLGDRMDISFIAILTIVAYQIMVSSTIPQIPYFTMMSAFIYVSLITMAASVVVNLAVGRLDRGGKRAQGDRVDRVSRWAFPVAYVGQLVLVVGYFFLRY